MTLCLEKSSMTEILQGSQGVAENFFSDEEFAVK